jgi:hypothetical protein
VYPYYFWARTAALIPLSIVAFVVANVAFHAAWPFWLALLAAAAVVYLGIDGIIILVMALTD